MLERKAESVKNAKRSIRKNILVFLTALFIFIPALSLTDFAFKINADETSADGNVSTQTQAMLGDNEWDNAQTQAVLGGDGQGTNGQGTNGQGANGQGANGQGANGQGTNGQGANGQGTNGQGTDGDIGGLGETLGDNPELNELFDALNITADTTTIDLIILITILTLAPSLLIMLTCFTRIIISFSLLRNAMGIAMTPPNQVMIGLALFMTFFIMSPVFTQMNDVAYEPYKAGEISSTEALSRASRPLKVWMLENTSNESMDFFLELSGEEALTEVNETQFIDSVKFMTVVPAFILSEIKIGFQIGFLLYVPFLIIDIVVATVLMSMGMMMLPPTTVSIPFKILLFVLVDGWSMLISTLVSGFNSSV